MLERNPTPSLRASSCFIPYCQHDLGSVFINWQLFFAYLEWQVLVKGNEIRLREFGTFKQKKSAARLGRNPRTGEELQILASTSVGFSISSAFKVKVWSYTSIISQEFLFFVWCRYDEDIRFSSTLSLFCENIEWRSPCDGDIRPCKQFLSRFIEALHQNSRSLSNNDHVWLKIGRAHV